MHRVITLDVSFPRFGKNYYEQSLVLRKRHHSLVQDTRFDAFMMPAAENHFSNEVVGLTDQFRFLTDILAMHLQENEAVRPASRSRQSAQTLSF